MTQPEVAVRSERVDPARANGESSSAEGIGEALGRSRVQLEQSRFELELGKRVQERLLKEIEQLERRLADREAERLELLERVEERDRLLSQVFGSRTWRWSQRLRRLLRRA